MNASIVGIGTWLPETVRTNDAWPRSFVERNHARGARCAAGSPPMVGDRTFNDIPPSKDPVAAALVERHLAAEAGDPFLGSVRRHVADPSMSAAEAEARAALAALEDANIEPRDVDLVLSYSTVPDRVMAAAPAVAHRIGAYRTRAFGIDAACASALPQLEMAHAYVESGLAKVVLLVQSHLVLRLMPLEHPATPGLGDAATAMVISCGTGLTVRGHFARSMGEFTNAVSWVRGTSEEEDLPWWKAGGDFRMGSRAPAQAKALMRDTVTYGSETLREAASAAGVDIERIDVLASVQPRGFLPGVIAERAGMASDRAVTTYEHIAHVGVCGPIFNLAAARAQGRVGRNALVALYGQGAGFTRAAAILEQTAPTP